MKRIGIINGPNLNLLGKREPGIYGDKTFETFLEEMKEEFPNVELRYYQSNLEGELINKLHEWGFTQDGILLNAGGYTHTSVALGDAVASIDAPVIEIHLSNILKREEFRHVDQIARACKGSIMGFGMESYRLGVLALLP